MKFQPADIVLVHAKGFNLLRLITGLYWNHALLIEKEIDGDYGTLESIDKGVAPTLLSNYIGQEIAVYRHKGMTPEIADDVIKAARGMGTYKYDFMIFFRILKRVGLRKGIKLILQFLNKEYPLEIPHIKDEVVVCSEMVQEAYSVGGLPLIDDKYLLTPDGIDYVSSCNGHLPRVNRGIYQGVSLPIDAT